MATDCADSTPCDKDLLENGELVFITHTIPSNAMEGWVKKVAALSGQRVDWHFVGGRACVRAIGDINKVEAALAQLMPEHDELYQKALKKYHV